MPAQHSFIEPLESRRLFSSGAALPVVFSIDPATLAQSKAQIAAGDAALQPAYNALIASANSDLSLAPLSVTDKPNPKGISPHDYVSYARYYWPNPKTKSGLPYINEDGKVNQAQVDKGDDGAIGTLFSAVEDLSLAYYFTGTASYADHAVEMIQTWFLDPATKMNPNMDHAQIALGLGSGRYFGILDARGMYELVNSLGLLQSASAWTAADQKSMNSWLTQYNNWLQTSDFGKEEDAAPNNHGTWFDVQHEAILLYLGKTSEARQIAEAFGPRRIATEVKSDGSQPLELARADGWSYSNFNLQALMTMADLAQRVGVNLWAYQAKDGASIRKAMDYLAPYANSNTPWPHNHLGVPLTPSNRATLIPELLQARNAYSSTYTQWLNDLSASAVASDQTQLFVAG